MNKRAYCLLGLLLLGCNRKIILPSEEPSTQASPTPSVVFEETKGTATPPSTFIFGASQSIQNSLRVSISGSGQPDIPLTISNINDLGSEVRIAMGDFDRDGISDLVLGSGPGVSPRVKILKGTDQSLLKDFSLAIANQMGGVYVATCDVNGDSQKDLVVGYGEGGMPGVIALDGMSGQLLSSFQAYGTGFDGGVRVACGALTGDGRDKIVTGAGPRGGPHVKVFDISGAVLNEFMAYSSGYTGGVYVATGDFDGNGREEIVVGPGGNSVAEVKIFNGTTPQQITSFQPYPTNHTGGVRVATVSFSGDARAEILTVPGPGLPPAVSIFDQSNAKVFESTPDSRALAVGGYPCTAKK